jgi:hypothetical protein
VHDVTYRLHQGIERDHFRAKKNMLNVGGFRSFNSVRKCVAGFEAMLRLKKSFGFSGQGCVREQNDLLAMPSGNAKVRAKVSTGPWISTQN